MVYNVFIKKSVPNVVRTSSFVLLFKKFRLKISFNDFQMKKEDFRSAVVNLLLRYVLGTTQRSRITEDALGCPLLQSKASYFKAFTCVCRYVLNECMPTFM